MITVTIKWGTEAVKGIEKAEEGYTIKTYTFENETQKAFFMKGVDEANGWLEYEVVEDELPPAKENKPEAGKLYALTGGPGSKCIANGNTWKDSVVGDEVKP